MAASEASFSAAEADSYNCDSDRQDAHIAKIRTSKSGLSHQAWCPKCGTSGPWRQDSTLAWDDSTRHEIMMIPADARDADERKMLAMIAGPDALGNPASATPDPSAQVSMEADCVAGNTGYEGQSPIDVATSETDLVAERIEHQMEDMERSSATWHILNGLHQELAWLHAEIGGLQAGETQYQIDRATRGMNMAKNQVSRRREVGDLAQHGGEYGAPAVSTIELAIAHDEEQLRELRGQQHAEIIAAVDERIDRFGAAKNEGSASALFVLGHYEDTFRELRDRLDDGAGDSDAAAERDYMDVLVAAANEGGDSQEIIAALEDDAGATPPRADEAMLDGIIAAAEDIDVRECAMWHPNMAEDHLEAIADNDAYNEEVRVAALSVLEIRR